MSDYQRVKIEAVDQATVILQVHEEHPDMAELGRVVDRKGQVRRSMARRLINFAALLLVDYNGRSNSFADLLQFLVDVGAAVEPGAAAGRLLASVEIEDFKRIGEGTDGPLHSARLVVTARSALAFASFRKGKRYGAAAALDGDIDL